MEIIFMEINFDEWKQEQEKQLQDLDNAYEDIQEKILNENEVDFHTMLMKNDFQNYLQLDYEVWEVADLTDFNLLEKEMTKLGGNKKR